MFTLEKGYVGFFLKMVLDGDLRFRRGLLLVFLTEYLQKHNTIMIVLSPVVKNNYQGM